MEQKLKITRNKIKEKLQEGLDVNNWSIVGTRGSNAAFLKLLIEYLKSKGIEVH